MAQNHYRCTACGVVVLLTYRAQDTDDPDFPGTHAVENCLGGGGTLELAPQPGDFAMDAGSGPAFKAFTIAREVLDLNPKTGVVERHQRMETIDSVHTLRRIEADSEQRYRNGEGEPLRFRMWNQGDSNRDVGSFGTAGTIGTQTYTSGEQPGKNPRIGVQRHGQEKPRIATGPGVARGGVTALKDR